MTFNQPATIDALISQAEEEHLYFKLIEQVNKDFALANEPLDVPASIFPFEFKNLVQEKIYKLIQYKFAEYLNIQYRYSLGVQAFSQEKVYLISFQLFFSHLTRR